MADTDKGKPLRTTINLTDLRDLIERAHDGPMWAELTINQQVRVLLRERLAQIFPEQAEQLGIKHQDDK